MDPTTQDLGPGVRRRRRPDVSSDRRTTAEDVRRHQPAASGGLLLQGIGLFGVGLGLTQIIAPRVVQRVIGAPVGESTIGMRLMGVRELISGLGILSGRKAETFVGGRVVGDVLDLSVLAALARSPEASPGRLAVAAAAVLGVGALDVLAQRKLKSGAIASDALGHVEATRAVTIGRSPQEVYAFYRELSNLPRFVQGLESVEKIGENRYHLKSCGPLGTKLAWDIEIVDDQPGQSMTWVSLGQNMSSRGKARFLPAAGGRGTEVVVTMATDAIGGRTGAAASVLLGELPLGMRLVSDLRRMKQLIELGEIMKSDASIHEGMHPAVPATAEEKKEIER